MRNRWDIFCRVVDNFGDIGVCWRLAQQLAIEHGLAVRLWVDDLDSLVPLCPSIAPVLDRQNVLGIEVRRWPDVFPETVVAAEVVIEAFACDLPASYLHAMCQSPAPPVWINLEYLSAEVWVEGCHALSSPHPSLPLLKHFYFPGFTQNTGGLLRERHLFAERDALQCALTQHNQLEISLFCYDTAPLVSLIEAWILSRQAIRCRVPPGQALAVLSRHFGGQGPWQRGNLRVEPIPFLPQSEYDLLLWECDINFVRGEDSFVRAQWAGLPFVWQIYRQDDAAHRVKLDAFLDRYLEALPETLADVVRRFFVAWNESNKDLAQSWNDFSEIRPALAAHTRKWSRDLAQNDLAANLVKFCMSRL